MGSQPQSIKVEVIFLDLPLISSCFHFPRSTIEDCVERSFNLRFLRCLSRFIYTKTSPCSSPQPPPAPTQVRDSAIRQAGSIFSLSDEPPAPSWRQQWVWLKVLCLKTAPRISLGHTHIGNPLYKSPQLWEKAIFCDGILNRSQFKGDKCVIGASHRRSSTSASAWFPSIKSFTAKATKCRKGRVTSSACLWNFRAEATWNSSRAGHS